MTLLPVAFSVVLDPNDIPKLASEECHWPLQNYASIKSSWKSYATQTACKANLPADSDASCSQCNAVGRAESIPGVHCSPKVAGAAT